MFQRAGFVEDQGDVIKGDAGDAVGLARRVVDEVFFSVDGAVAVIIDGFANAAVPDVVGVGDFFGLRARRVLEGDGGEAVAVAPGVVDSVVRGDGDLGRAVALGVVFVVVGAVA